MQLMVAALLVAGGRVMSTLRALQRAQPSFQLRFSPLCELPVKIKSPSSAESTTRGLPVSEAPDSLSGHASFPLKDIPHGRPTTTREVWNG